MAEPLISVLLEQITQVITQQVQEEVNLVRGVEKQANKLKTNLINIQTFLEDAERKQVKEKTVRAWLHKLKDVCYDMDDVLDEWSYAILTWKTGDAKENIHNRQKIRCSFLRSPCFCLNQVVQRRDIALKIKEVSEKVDEIVSERTKLGLLQIKVIDHEPQQQKHASTSQVELNVYGRDDEKKIVVSKLLAESSQDARNVDVISLVGLGGIGKTTLARLAFNDAKVTTHFEKKMWVCVSEAFNEVRIAKAILEEFEGSTPNLVELQTLLQRVSQSIKEMRFLLVLDDVWTENHEHWEQLERSLTGCARGSRILVTTRNANVATMMRTNHRINIDTLSEDACRSIFNHLAFHERDKDECERLTDIGNEIANKCKGLPLAAKVLGGLMQSKRTRKEWECVFPKLKSLWIENLKELEEWDGIERRVGEEDATTTSIFIIMPQLQRLFIHNCPLKRLQIWGLSELEEWDGIERRVGEEDATTTSIFIIMPQLQHLGVVNCPLLRALPDYVLATSLQDLELCGCGNLEVLPLLGRLPNLESLELDGVGVGVRRLDAGFLGIEEVENANNINEGETARVTAFPKLKRLWLMDLRELEEWDGIERRVGEEDATTTSIFIIMPLLQHLRVGDCRLLRALPDYVLAAPLQELFLTDCPNLSNRYGKEKGEDWHKISHIPNVIIL